MTRATTTSLTTGLLRRPGNPGTKGRLLAKSLEAYLLGLETINRLTVAYRVETFCALMFNAWELLLKAKILDDTRDRLEIYYRRRPGEPLRSISLRDAVARVIPNDRDQTRRNIERVADLRDAAVHLFIAQVPKNVMGLLQACVLNYHRRLSEWFDISLADRVPVGMMSLVYDVSPESLDLSSALMRRRLGKDSAEYLTSLADELRAEHESHGMAPEFSVVIRYGLALQKRAEDASVVAVTGTEGTPIQIVERPRDSAITHPWRQKELLPEVNARLGPGLAITLGQLQAVVAAHDVKGRPEWFFRGSVRGSPGQYSPAFADWLADRVRNDAEFVSRSLESVRTATAARRAASSER
jgi:hypothetical protein